MADSFVDIFQQLKTILCLCPHCSSLLRVSQLLHLRSTAPAPRTWLDDYDDQIQKLQNKSGSVATKEDKLHSQEREMREKSRERGRKRVVSTVLKSMDDYFSKKKYNPYDIKPIIHPVDFVIFNGDHDKQVNEVVFLSNVLLIAFATAWTESMSKPESGSSNIEILGFNTVISNTSDLFFTPPENPSF